MTTEFAIEWSGFTSSEKRQLRTRWVQLRFNPEFCAQFSGKTYKGAPGEPGGIWIYPNDVRRFEKHWGIEVDFRSLNELIRMAGEVVEGAARQWERMVTQQQAT